MSASQFSSTMACANCGDDIQLTLRTGEDRMDYWLSEDERLTCASCGGMSTISVSEEGEAFVESCEDIACTFCSPLP